MAPINITSRHILLVLLLVGTGLLCSCSRILTGVMLSPTLKNMRQQTDVELVCDGAPSLLLMLDSMLVNAPDNSDMLRVGSQAFSSYAAALDSCSESQNKIQTSADKARLYGLQLLRLKLGMDRIRGGEQLDQALARLHKGDVPDVFWGTWGWLSWVRAQHGSPQSVADLVAIERIMLRLLELDETFESGAIHLFFGIYYGTKPPLLGGEPELARNHFLKALKISHHHFLPVQTAFAETVARITMDQELHDRLLQEVLSFDLASAPEFALSNRIAMARAKTLLEENYFGE